METVSMKILKALETNSRLTNSDLAIMLDVSED